MGNVFQSASEEPQMAQRSHVLPFHTVEDRDDELERLDKNIYYYSIPFGIPDRPPHSPGPRVPTRTAIQVLPSTPYLSNALPFHEVENDELLRLFDHYTHSTFLSSVYDKPKLSTESRVLTTPIQGLLSTPSSSSSMISVSPSSPLAGSSTPGTSTDMHNLNTETLFVALGQEFIERDIRDAADLGQKILALEEKEDLDAVEKERAMKALFETWAVMYERVRALVDADGVKLDAQLVCVWPSALERLRNGSTSGGADFAIRRGLPM